LGVECVEGSFRGLLENIKKMSQGLSFEKDRYEDIISERYDKTFSGLPYKKDKVFSESQHYES